MGFSIYFRLVEHVHEFADGLEYDKNLDYCQFPDRTFQHERINGLQAPSKEYLTNQQPTKDIPANCYDTVEGYYDPQTKIVYKKDNKILNVVTAEEEQTMKQYRKVPDGPVGFMAGLYEFWTIGKKKEMKQIEELYAHDNKTKTTTTSPAPESETSLLYSYWG
ncbi:hypothetical protein JTB14_006513 [Gonioctena quinquepunctata]|nr:hypothetical protein JTB14_006513 [Gonioctena quinquepunctata]